MYYYSSKIYLLNLLGRDYFGADGMNKYDSRSTVRDSGISRVARRASRGIASRGYVQAAILLVICNDIVLR
jgi:hypothetical protein